MTAPLQSWVEHDGALLRLRLARPKANIVDAEMIGALRLALAEPYPALRGVILDAQACSRLLTTLLLMARITLAQNLADSA